MELQETDSVTTAAAKAGFSRATGYRVLAPTSTPPENPPPKKRTRPDPLADIFEPQVVPLLEAHAEIRPKAVHEYLLEQASGYQPKYRRTLERRIRDWRALHGPDQEVVFPQNPRPAGSFALSDFTHVPEDTITISGRPLKHLLYHFRLPWSGYS